MKPNFANQEMIARFGQVDVLYGGTSAEREISLRSGGAIIQALREVGVATTPVDIGSDPLQQLQQLSVDRAFIALHGTGGEDGKIQALLEWLNLPYTGS